MCFRAEYTRSLVALSLNLTSHHTSAQSSNVYRPGSVAIVELFTSEGGSSCSPADSLLRQSNLRQTSQLQLVVDISEHVTYWSGLGWETPYTFTCLH